MNCLFSTVQHFHVVIPAQAGIQTGPSDVL